MAAKNAKKSHPKTPALPVPAWPTPRTAVDRIRVGYEDLTGRGKDTLSALVAANAALSDGLERVGLELVGLGRTLFESAAAACAALLDAGTLEDVVVLQSDFARTYVERMFASGARLSELGLKAASDAYEPLGTCAGKAIGALAKPLAA